MPRETTEHKTETLAERLAKDPEFQKLSRGERIKRYEAEQAKESQQREEPQVEAVNVNAKRHAQILASTFGHSTGAAVKEQHRVTKEDMRNFKKLKKEKKDKRMRAWLLED